MDYSHLTVISKKSEDNENKGRIVIDYRKLNNVTVGQFSMPNIESLFDKL